MNSDYKEKLCKQMTDVPLGKLSQNEYFLKSSAPLFSLQQCHIPPNGKGSIEVYGLHKGIRSAFVYLNADHLKIAAIGSDSVLEIHYCRYGQAVWTFEKGERAELMQGDFALIPSHAVCGANIEFPQGYYAGVAFCIDLDQLSKKNAEAVFDAGTNPDFFKDAFIKGGSCSVFSGDEEASALFEALFDLPVRFRVSYFKLKLQEILLHLIRVDGSPERVRNPYCPEYKKIMQEVHEQLISDLSCRVTIEDLSKQYLINATTLKTMFKAIYGTSIAAHIKMHRMEKAAALLLDTQDSVAAISRAVGYENQSKFTAAFKESFNMLPTEYRKKGKSIVFHADK